MSNDYTPRRSSTGVMADSSDRRPGAEDEFKSWNRWRDDEARPDDRAGETHSDPATEIPEDRAESSSSVLPAESTDQSQPVANEPGAQDDGYVPSRRARNPKGRRRGGGRHRIKDGKRKDGKRSKAPRSRRARRDAEVALESRAERTLERPREQQPEPKPDPVFNPKPEPDPVFNPEPDPDPVFNPEPDPVFNPEPEPIYEPRARRIRELQPVEPARVIDELIERVSQEEPASQRTAPPRRTPRPERVREGSVDTAEVSRKRLERPVMKILILTVVVLLALGAYAVLRRNGSSAEGSGRSNTATGGEAVTTTLIAGTRARGDKAVWLTLLSYDKSTDEGAVVYVPAHTAVEVPGRGLQGVGESLNDGDVELLLLSAKSLLNVEIDHYLELTPEDTQALLAGIGALTVDVPSEVRIPAGRGRARLLFASGIQELSPARATELLFTVGSDGDELDLGPRHLAFWDALYDTYEDDPNALAAALARAGNIGRSDTELSDHVDLVAELAEAGSQRRNLSVIPVAPVSVGKSELYSIDEDALGEFMRSTAHAEPPTHDAVRVQVLNGNGYPGIGQEIAGRLLGEGYRVVLSGNARNLNHGRTLIVTYDATPEGLQLAQEARTLVGVGQVQVSRLDQGIVDLTIVVGKDFLRKP